MRNSSSFFGGLLAGAAIGAVLALLYAPARGKETREQLKSKLNDLMDQLEKLKRNVKSSFGDTSDLQQKISDLEKQINAMKAEQTPNQ